jgi:hypothetical protein
MEAVGLRILKAIWAFIDWLLFFHGYDLHGNYEIKGLPVVTFKCKNCGDYYKSVMRNDTCSKLKCYVGYRAR